MKSSRYAEVTSRISILLSRWSLSVSTFYHQKYLLSPCRQSCLVSTYSTTERPQSVLHETKNACVIVTHKLGRFCWSTNITHHSLNRRFYTSLSYRAVSFYKLERTRSTVPALFSAPHCFCLYDLGIDACLFVSSRASWPLVDRS